MGLLGFGIRDVAVLPPINLTRTSHPYSYSPSYSFPPHELTPSSVSTQSYSDHYKSCNTSDSCSDNAAQKNRQHRASTGNIDDKHNDPARLRSVPVSDGCGVGTGLDGSDTDNGRHPFYGKSSRQECTTEGRNEQGQGWESIKYAGMEFDEDSFAGYRVVCAFADKSIMMFVTQPAYICVDSKPTPPAVPLPCEGGCKLNGDIGCLENQCPSCSFGLPNSVTGRPVAQRQRSFTSCGGSVIAPSPAVGGSKATYAAMREREREEKKTGKRKENENENESKKYSLLSNPSVRNSNKSRKSSDLSRSGDELDNGDSYRYAIVKYSKIIDIYRIKLISCLLFKATREFK